MNRQKKIAKWLENETLAVLLKKLARLTAINGKQF